MKTCTKCEAAKPPDDYPMDRSKRDGRHTQCRACHSRRNRDRRKAMPEAEKQASREKSRNWRLDNPERSKASVRNATLKKKYGITLEDYTALLSKQRGQCRICGTLKSEWGQLAVDHNHDTGAVRGLLCFNCNTSIGKMGDDPKLLRRAAEYLEESSKS